MSNLIRCPTTELLYQYATVFRTYILKIGHPASPVYNSYYDGDDSLHPARNSLSSASSSSPSTASSNNERRAKNHLMDKPNFCTANRKDHEALAVLKISFVNFQRNNLRNNFESFLCIVTLNPHHESAMVLPPGTDHSLSFSCV